MAKHEITVSMPPKAVLNKDTEYTVFSDGQILGSLKISRGSVEWRPKNNTYGYHLSWEDFDKLMKERGAK